MKLTCVGTGDAFGSGGRLNSCFHLQTDEQQLLIDCGSSSLIGLERCGIPLDEVDTVVISHLHGDHFGGIPYLFLEGKYLSQRTRPLSLIGPAGLKKRVETVANALYPGLSANNLDFPVNYQTLEDGKKFWIHDLQILPVAVKHGGSKYAYGFRLESGGKTIAYSGDTEWTDALISLARNSDLLVAECFTHSQSLPGHLNYRTLIRERERLGCQHLVLTHLGPEMLAQRDTLRFDVVSDGDILEV